MTLHDHCGSKYGGKNNGPASWISQISLIKSLSFLKFAGFHGRDLRDKMANRPCRWCPNCAREVKKFRDSGYVGAKARPQQIPFELVVQ